MDRACPLSRPPLLRVAVAAALAFAAIPCGATVLYKSIAANGVVQFSDVPPEHGTIVEERTIPEPSAGQAMVVASAEAIGGLGAAPFGDPTDEEIERANQQVDLAEHALALARGPGNSAREAMQLSARPRTAEDTARIAFYERNLYTARRTLLLALKRRSMAPP